MRHQTLTRNPPLEATIGHNLREAASAITAAQLGHQRLIVRGARAREARLPCGKVLQLGCVFTSWAHQSSCQGVWSSKACVRLVGSASWSWNRPLRSMIMAKEACQRWYALMSNDPDLQLGLLSSQLMQLKAAAASAALILRQDLRSSDY